MNSKRILLVLNCLKIPTLLVMTEGEGWLSSGV